jgi:hypothetical protein
MLYDVRLQFCIWVLKYTNQRISAAGEDMYTIRMVLNSCSGAAYTPRLLVYSMSTIFLFSRHVFAVLHIEYRTFN